jgi:porin
MVAGRTPFASAQAAHADGAPSPVSLTLSYTGQILGNGGGERSGVVTLGLVGAQGTLRLHRLLGWRGAQVYLSVLGTYGGQPSDLVGDVQGVSNLEGPSSVWIEEVWLQQNLFADRLSWLVGRYDLNSEFYRLQSGALFVNSSFGIGPEFAQSGAAGPSIYPNTAVGTRVAFKPSSNSVVRLALLDGAPVGRADGSSQIFAAGDGVLLVGEVALLVRPDSTGQPRERRFRIGRGMRRPYADKVALGGWYYTAQFPDLSETLPTGGPVLHQGSRGAYLIGDKTVLSAGPGRTPMLTAFVQLGWGDGRVNQIGGYLGGGVALAGPFRGRAQDEMGLAVAAALNGSHYERAQTEAGLSAAGETAVELTYLAQLTPWLAMQPDVQYVVHPGGTGATPNAFVAGLGITLSR